MSVFDILICSYCIDKEDVSEARMAYDWISKLAEKYKICVVTTGARIHPQTGLENNQNIQQIVLPPKISFKWTGALDRALHPGYMEFYFKAKKTIRQILQNHSVKICHHLTPQSLRYPSPFADLDCKYICGPLHGGIKPPPVMKELGVRESPLFLLRNLDSIRAKIDPWLNKTWKNAECILISAPYVKDLLQPEYRDKCKVLSGIAIDESMLGETSSINTSDKLNMIFVGRIVPSKGIELVIRALAKLPDKNMVSLQIYGTAKSQNNYQRLAQTLGVNSIIQWKGFVPNEKLKLAYRNSDCFILPSLKEPAGIAFIEAMANGLPVICVDYGGPAHTVTNDCGIKIPLGNVQQMVDALTEEIQELAKNKHKLQAMAQQSRSRVEREFTWPAVINKMQNIYSQMIDL